MEKEEAEEVVHKIKKDGGSAFIISADLSTLNGINKLYPMMEKSLQKHIGDNTVDILVNNLWNRADFNIRRIHRRVF